MNIKLLIIPISFLCLTISCTSTDEIGSIENKSEYASVTMVIPPIEIIEDDTMTKMTVDLSTKPISYLWDKEDVVGIFPSKGSQIYFSMADGVGTSTVTFDGGGWALKKGSDYFSYFPFIPDFYLDMQAIPLTFVGQNQIGNGDLTSANVGKYCYMAARGKSDENTGNLRFEYERLGIVTRHKVPVDAGTYKSLDIVIDEPLIAYDGTFNSVDVDRKINNARYSDKLSMTFEDLTLENTDEPLVAFMMIPPFNILNKQLTIKLTKSDGTVVSASDFGKDFVLGTAYGINPKLSVYAKNALIDGNGGTAQIVITANNDAEYSVSSDVDWLTLESNPKQGSAVVNVTAGKGLETQRKGHIIVTRNETYKGITITLQDKVEITQDLIGMKVGIGNWNKSEEDYGGSAH